MVEIYRVLWILEKVLVFLNTVRNVRIHKVLLSKILFQGAWIIGLDEFQEFQQVDDLVITPVPNVRPWVVRLNCFPIETVFYHTVRVISVKRSCVQEFVDHTLHKFRVRMCQCLPVLENVTPVSLVIEDFFSRHLIASIDREFVPRS